MAIKQRRTWKSPHGQHHAAAALEAGKPSNPCTGSWVGFEAGLEKRGKSRPSPGFNPPTLQPIASSYTVYSIPTAKQRFRFAQCVFKMHDTSFHPDKLCYSKTTRKNLLGEGDEGNREFLLFAWCCIPNVHPALCVNQSKGRSLSEV